MTGVTQTGVRPACILCGAASECQWQQVGRPGEACCCVGLHQGRYAPWALAPAPRRR